MEQHQHQSDHLLQHQHFYFPVKSRFNEGNRMET
uniref:Uncharacterized protein n=1 Tax=Tetranychus urticae TaxID=32264 RepID=T1L259_TETUR